INFAPIAGFQRELVEGLDRLADEKRPTLRIEGTIGAEQHVIDAEEVEPAADRARRAVDRRIAVEHLEKVQWALFHALEQTLIVLVGGAGTELVHSIADAIDEKRRHRPEMVRDDLQLRQL